MKRGQITLLVIAALVAVTIVGYLIYSNYSTSVSINDTLSTDVSTIATPSNDTLSTDVSTIATPSNSANTTGGTGRSSNGSSPGTGSENSSGGGSGSTGLNVSSSPSGPAAVNLGTAGDFVILSKAGISTTGTTSI